MRSYGWAALDLPWAASARLGYQGRFPSPWGLAAGSLLCREAGLVVERLTADGDGEPRLLAVAPGLAAPLRAFLWGASTGR